MSIEFIGYASGILFAVCAVPQAIKSFEDGHSNGISGGFLTLWLLGEILAQIYVYNTHGLDMPLFINYWFNCLFISVILYYKLFPNKPVNTDNVLDLQKFSRRRNK